MVKLGEFFLKDRAARFEPTVDLRQDMAERETFQPFREADFLHDTGCGNSAWTAGQHPVDIPSHYVLPGLHPGMGPIS